MNKLLPGICLLLAPIISHATDYDLTSPDKKISVKVQVTNTLQWSVSYNNETLLLPSAIRMELANGMVLGQTPVLKKQQRNTVNGTIDAVVPVKQAHIPEQYNELRLSFKGNYAVCFRAYNDGVAYRFETALGKEITVKSEPIQYQLPEDERSWWPVDGHVSPTFQSHYEYKFEDTSIAKISDKLYAGLPIYLSSPRGTKMVITEANLHDYPNQFLFGTNGNALKVQFPPVILKEELSGDRNTKILQNADYIAKTSGTRTFPWRTLIISPDDKGLLENELVYKLAAPNTLENTSWIKPGKVSWDWWNANNIYGVDFRAGINTATYKYYIDFAAKYGLEYIILDEGWTRSTLDILHSTPQLDMPELVSYAKSKNVGIILWVLWNALDEHMTEALDLYASWGIKGIKVDFMQRGDQWMVNFYERTAQECAKRHMLVDYHGAYKPVGLNRTYPNVINFEGVKGLENSKGGNDITPGHDVTLPFTRMVAGPMDYTPGAMLNANKSNFRHVFSEPMSQGTRCHQAAMYVVYDAPLQMLCDNPSNYLKEPEYTRFIAQVPTTWDTTVALQGKAGEYVALARKKGDTWYIGAMTNWEARHLDLDLSFLGSGSYQLEAVEDGINADEHAADYRFHKQTVTAADHVTVQMSKGGGWMAVLKAAH
ncbi:MAG TPA: glycoside hydrolase family 97 protein [Chitinophaga sp.]|uniref:glycoside hydrolase family 97 protein n=1 Tax=Chitinophaga sp. TaxID=1869181 RepID=UPI002DBF17F8|nr:glycoside hydrolase family 97 protein [Chitinophaga sp.]HEU4553938.1 glycoside hydrolase family 97 protein [Chitinophaga sp.]